MTGSNECAACSGRKVFAVDAWPTGKRTRAMACGDCGLLFLEDVSAQDAPIAGDRSLDALWSSGETTTASKKGAASALMAALDSHADADAPPAGRVLSLGSGAAAWLNVFRDQGWETFGIEGETVQPGSPHQWLAGLPTDPRFDLVIAYHVLERARRPLDALTALAQSIRPGGHCFISVPRLDTLAEHRQTRYCLRPGKAVSAFTESCLRGLMARAGLEVVTALHKLGHGDAAEESLRLRLLARRVESASAEPNLAAALERVLSVLPSLDPVSKVSDATPVVPDPTSCPACDGADVHFVEEWRLPGKESRAAACRDCGLLFVHPQPTSSELDAYYAPDGGWRASRTDRHVAEAGSPQNKTEGAAASIFPALDRFFRASEPLEGARVFDFGCGQGAWLNSFQDRGWDTYGLEPSTDVAFARHKRVLTIPSVPQFDVLIVYHVLEHLPRPLDTLRDLAGSLVPGGYCLVSVPRIDMLAVHQQVDYCLHPRHHIVGYTEACMRGLLARAGLEVVQSLHALDSAYSKGRPVRLQLLARKASGSLRIEPGAAEALEPVIAAYAALRSPGSLSPARPRAANE
jgi:2-polyprenyl-3-methyl-5-hydroxy-6-metoxy-1,4-benzoquinol methylase